MLCFDHYLNKINNYITFDNLLEQIFRRKVCSFFCEPGEGGEELLQLPQLLFIYYNIL